MERRLEKVEARDRSEGLRRILPHEVFESSENVQIPQGADRGVTRFLSGQGL